MHVQGLCAFVGVQQADPLAPRQGGLQGNTKDGTGHARHEKGFLCRVVGKVAHGGRFLGAFQPAHVALQLGLEGALAPPGAPLPEHRKRPHDQQAQADGQAQGQPFAHAHVRKGLCHIDLGDHEPR